MTTWTFKIFLKKNADKTINVIDEWLEEQPPKAQARIRAIINYLKITQAWPIQYFKQYRGHPYIYEIIIKCGNIQYRPLGCFGPGENEFTLLIGAKEKGDRIEPASAPDTAEERRELILKDRSYIDDFI